MAALLFSLSLLFVTQANQANLIHTLQTGMFPERQSALSQIAQIPPAERTEPLWLTLAQALEDEQAENHRETDALLAQPQIPGGGDERGDHGEARSEYLHQLILELAQWHDPRELAALISAAGTGNDAIEPVVQFGEAAVAPLITGARQGHFMEQFGVLRELQILLEGRSDISPAGVPVPGGKKIAPAQLSAQSKQQIRALASDLLKPKALKIPEATLRQVSRLALATGDADLRQQVQTLADLPSELSNTTGITDANKLVQVQNSIRAALAEHKQ